MAIEPACFHCQPDAPYGVELGPIGQQIHRLPVVSIGYQQNIADKFSVDTGQEHLDGATASSCFIRAHPENLLEFFDGRIFPMGYE
jgi:hypothetical protein